MTDTPGADPGTVGGYLAAALDDEAWRDCTVAHVAGGKSNLTYIVSSRAGDVVLRRPPLAAVLPTAHDMVREHRVQAALAATPVPVPAMLALCADAAVLGAPFYVMSKVDGVIARNGLPEGYADTPPARAAITDALIDVLVALHAVDPGAVGLATFGRPAGYLERQLRRWSAQWEATRAVAVPAVDDLLERLSTALPASGQPAIVHGDYRLDNTVLDPADPARVLAVLDWEMSTLGDPLADLGLLLVYWSGSSVVPTVTDSPGFPTREQVAERYAACSGRDITALPWYVAFGYLKLAVVVAGIAARHAAGGMVGEGFVGMAEHIEPLARSGRDALR